ncbi:MAG: type II toxin-antitoxin system HicB family antitoxin [Bacteroidales bacterium]|nr:type II toxin-antitoxin system HicB family antitoxin [Bacteroidales bacterium]
MKSLDEYMKMPYRLEIVPDTEESGFVATYPELPGCITCGETLADVILNVEDAKREWLLAAIEDNVPIYEPKDDYIKTQVLGLRQRIRTPELETPYYDVPDNKTNYLNSNW